MIGWPDAGAERSAARKGDVVMNAQDFDAEPRSLSQENLKRCRSGPGRRGFELSEGADYARACAVAYIGGLKERCLRNPQMPGGGMDGRADCGHTPRSPGAGAKRGDDDNPACHFDGSMRNGKLRLDDARMVARQRSVRGDVPPASGPSL